VIQLLAFYLFAFVVCASGAMTILSRNPVHSVLWLILAFFNAAGLMVLANAEFIAMLLVIVYVGAVAVLFLFVVMMLNIDFAELRAGVMRYAAVGASRAGARQVGRRVAPGDAKVPHSGAIGQLLDSRYLFVFEGAGLVLLVAMIGAIVLTLRPRTDVKPQKISRQVQRRAKDATRNVNHPVGQGVEL